jgi:hypothetical protein
MYADPTGHAAVDVDGNTKYSAIQAEKKKAADEAAMKKAAEAQKKEAEKKKKEAEKKVAKDKLLSPSAAMNSTKKSDEVKKSNPVIVQGTGKGNETIQSDPYVEIRAQAEKDASDRLSGLMGNLHSGFWIGGYYILAEETWAKFALQDLKGTIDEYEAKDQLNLAIIPATIIESYQEISELSNGIPFPHPALQLLPLASGTVGLSALSFMDYSNTDPSASGFVGAWKGSLAEKRDIANSFVKFSYVMNSDYKFLMIGPDGRKDFLSDLKDTKTQIQKMNFNRYKSSQENDIYKAAYLKYIDKIIDMNTNFGTSRDRLIDDFEKIKNGITDNDVDRICNLFGIAK